MRAEVNPNLVTPTPTPATPAPVHDPDLAYATVYADDAPDQTHGIIPYKNVCAAGGYYLGIFSFVGLFLFIVPGLLMGGAAVALGILGLVHRRRRPNIKGSIHAWVAIVCGGISILIALAVIIAVSLSIMRS